MLNVIRRARRRLLANELIAQAANALSAALLAFILLLLAGTEILRWEWLLSIPVAAAGAGIFLALKRLPAPYVTAQIVDRRLRLADALSTAWFFSRTPPQHAAASMVAAQQEAARQLAATADLRLAIPLKVPRRAYVVACLALVASSLFALRYGITRRLDLHPPLARLIEQQFGLEPKTVLAKNVRRDPPPAGQPDDPADDLAAQDPNRSADQQASNGQQSPEDGGDRTADKKGNGNRSDTDKQPDGTGQQSAADQQDEQSDQQQNPSDPRDAGNSGQQGNRRSDQGRQSNSQREANGANESSSLLTKMKDAFQNLLSRVKPQQGGQGSQQASDKQGKQQGKGQQNAKQQAAKDGQQGDSGQQGDAQEGQSGERAENSADPQSKGQGKSDGQQSSKQPGSGIGSQDGDKSIRQAEQLAAMGKISEIIGKRSANLTGEATVEVQSTNQQLHTPYAQRGAQHAQGGAEIDRDEIPEALQGYVEKYFEQVRKQAPPKK